MCSDSVGLGKAEISKKLPDDADPAGSQTTLSNKAIDNTPPLPVTPPLSTGIHQQYLSFSPSFGGHKFLTQNLMLAIQELCI